MFLLGFELPPFIFKIADIDGNIDTEVSFSTGIKQCFLFSNCFSHFGVKERDTRTNTKTIKQTGSQTLGNYYVFD